MDEVGCSRKMSRRSCRRLRNSLSMVTRSDVLALLTPVPTHLSERRSAHQDNGWLSGNDLTHGHIISWLIRSKLHWRSDGPVKVMAGFDVPERPVTSRVFRCDELLFESPTASTTPAHKLAPFEPCERAKAKLRYQRHRRPSKLLAAKAKTTTPMI